MITNSEYPALKLTQLAVPTLKGRETLVVKLAIPQATITFIKKQQPLSVTGMLLLDHLKILRNNLAKQEAVPAYIVFSNASLIDIL